MTARTTGDPGSTADSGSPEGASGLGAPGIALRIDAESPVPPFEQLRTGIRDAVASGDLAAGARLPTVRALAGELGLAANTVARAYRELESDGLIETRGRLGSFVSATGSPAEREAQLAARAYADRTASLGIPAPDALAFIAAALGLDRDRDLDRS